MNPQEMVIEFHHTYNLPVVSTPSFPVWDRMKLRISLIEEESKEACDAIAYGNTEHVAQELADLVYVAYGAALEFGIDLDAVIAEVHRSNMSKLGPGGKILKREDGKIMKGPYYSPPDIGGVLYGRSEEAVNQPPLPGSVGVSGSTRGASSSGVWCGTCGDWQNIPSGSFCCSCATI